MTELDFMDALALRHNGRIARARPRAGCGGRRPGAADPPGAAGAARRAGAD